MTHPLPALSELIERARSVVMTDAQAAAQRRSFAFGNTVIDNPRITRELVDRADAELFGVAAEIAALDQDCARALPFALSASPRRVLWLIARRSPTVLSVDAIWCALYGLRAECDQPIDGIKCIHFFIHQIRAALPDGIAIETLYGVGYRMTRESRDRLFSLAGVTE